MYEIFLEGDRGPSLELYEGAHSVVTHRHYMCSCIEPLRDFGRDLAQARARIEALRAVKMGREVAIAKIEPGRTVKTRECAERVEGFALESPSVRAADHTRERINDRVDIRRDVEPIEVFVIAGVDHDAQVARVNASNQSADELSRTHSPRKRGDREPGGREQSGARHWEPFCRRVFCRAWFARPRRAPSRALSPRSGQPARTRPTCR